MQNKPEIVFTFPACMGGVSSFNYNIINHSRLIRDFHSKVILIKALEDKRPLFLDSFKADEVITFEFSYRENQYYVQKRLGQLLGDGAGAIVTDNALTVYAARQSSNPKTVFHLVHDFFYVNQAAVLGDLVDISVAHAAFFSDAVFASNPPLFANRFFYIPYGVQQVPAMAFKNNALLNLVFLGRLDESKGVLKLHEIEEGLKKNNINVNWTVIGKGPLKQALLDQWGKAPNIHFFEPDSTADVYQILSNQDIFVFPTSFEGTPVSILEALANGIVTITNDLPGGIRDIVKEGIGYRCDINNTDQFVEHIMALNNNRELLKNMQQNCYSLAVSSYDIEKNADHYFQKFAAYDSLKRKEKKQPVILSRLDKPRYPNQLVKIIRSLKS